MPSSYPPHDKKRMISITSTLVDVRKTKSLMLSFQHWKRFYLTIDFRKFKRDFVKNIVVLHLRLHATQTFNHANHGYLPDHFTFVAEKFEETKENKLEYTAIFREYTDKIEDAIENRLTERISVSPSHYCYWLIRIFLINHYVGLYDDQVRVSSQHEER